MFSDLSFLTFAIINIITTFLSIFISFQIKKTIDKIKFYYKNKEKFKEENEINNYLKKYGI